MYKKSGLIIFLSIMLVLAAMPGLGQNSDLQAASYDKPITGSAEPGAQSVINQEEALEIIKNTFPEICQDKVFKTNDEMSFNDENQLSFAWSDNEYKSIKSRGARITATVDTKNGELVRWYYRPDTKVYRGKMVTVGYDEALQIADNFINKLHSDKLSELKLGDRSAYEEVRQNYHFSWSRLKNNIPVNWDGIHIDVDAVTGEITSYNCYWHYCSFPGPDDKTIIPRDKLSSELLEKTGVYPVYRNFGARYYTICSVIPVYFLNNQAYVFDCYSGKALNWQGEEINAEDIRIYHQDFKPVQEIEGVKKLPKPEDKIAPEILKKTAAEFFKKIGVKGEIKTAGSNLRGDNPYTETWNFHLEKNKEKQEGECYQIAVNAYTNEIDSFYHNYSEETDNLKEINYDQAVKNARKMIEIINPGKSKKLVLNNDINQDTRGKRYYLKFDSLINGIVYNREGVRITVDRHSGELIYYDADSFEETSFARADKIMSPAAALDIIKASEPLELCYSFPDENKKKAEPRLVYRLKSLPLNALSGEFMNWRGLKPTSNAGQIYLSGHWGTEALNLLKQSNLIDETGFNPDGAVTRREAVRVLTACIDTNKCYRCLDKAKVSELNIKDISDDDPDRETIIMAVQIGFLEKGSSFNGEQVLSREDLAVWLINYLGYEELADMKHSFILDFNDKAEVSKNRTNYVGLINGLGFLTPDLNNNFRPKDNCTWAELATMVVRLAANN